MATSPDYGSAYLFQLYLWENYGNDAFTSALFHDQANGIEGVQNQLNAFGGGVAFNKVYDNWTLANYFDTMGPNAYGYKNLDIGPDTDGWTIQYMLDNYYNPWSLYPYGKFGLTRQPARHHLRLLVLLGLLRLRLALPAVHGPLLLL